MARIAALRAAMEAAGHRDVAILSYAAKVSHPAFTARSATRSARARGWWATRRPTRSNPANREEALACVARDLAEGADMVMVKPGMPYLDICRAVKDRFPAPRPSPIRSLANTRC